MKNPQKFVSLDSFSTDVALETAGYLRGLGFDSTVMIRSVPLRGFDQEMAKLVVRHMEGEGVKFLNRCNMHSFKRTGDGSVQATWKDRDVRVFSPRLFNLIDVILWAT